MTTKIEEVNQLQGVIAAVPTPITEDKQPNIKAFMQHAAWCLENGCDALNVLGTTGEATSFSTDQRLKLMHAVSEELHTNCLMVGTGCSDFESTLLLTRNASNLGFAGALILPPFYYKPVDDDGLFQYFSMVVEKTRDDDIDLYLYNFPQMTGLKFSIELVKRLAAAYPERIKGLKDSSGDLEYARTLAQNTQLMVFPSNETALAAAQENGFAGVISATVNLAPSLAQRVWAGDPSSNLLDTVRSIRESASRAPLVPAVKYLIGLRNEEDSWKSTLAPLLPIASGEHIAHLQEVHLKLERLMT